MAAASKCHVFIGMRHGSARSGQAGARYFPVVPWIMMCVYTERAVTAAEQWCPLIKSTLASLPRSARCHDHTRPCSMAAQLHLCINTIEQALQLATSLSACHARTPDDHEPSNVDRPATGGGGRVRWFLRRQLADIPHERARPAFRHKQPRRRHHAPRCVGVVYTGSRMGCSRDAPDRDVAAASLACLSARPRWCHCHVPDLNQFL